MSASPTLLSAVELRCEAARRLGCTVSDLDPETGYLFELRRGKKARVLLGGYSPLNDAGGARIAEDKFHTGLILRRAGFRVPATARCLKPGRFAPEDFTSHTGLAAGRRFTAEHGFPVVVKPNRGARGRDVQLAADQEELARAVVRIWQSDYLALVQELVAGCDLRLDFLDDEFLLGYLRRPVVVRGDGTSSWRELLARCDRRFSGEAFWKKLESDAIWVERAATRGWNPDFVPGEEEISLSGEILNLNRLCVAELVTELPAAWHQLARSIGDALSLRHFGIDFRTAGLASDPQAATVIEVNASPSLTQVARMGHFEVALAAEIKVVRTILSLDAGSSPDA